MESNASRMDRLTGDPQARDLKTLLAALEERALAKADGHLTIMRFTTHWKIMIGTPDYGYRSDMGCEYEWNRKLGSCITYL